jgi:hypothetical protein
MKRATSPVAPPAITAALPGGLQQQDRPGAADQLRRARKRAARVPALRERLAGLQLLRDACSARGARIAISVYDAAGNRHTASFTSRHTVLELRDGVCRAIENTELAIARLAQKRTRTRTRRLA